LKVRKREILPEFVNFINSHTFLKEFSFSKNHFIPEEETELQLSDYVLFFDGYLIIFELKERDKDSISESIDTELKWIKNKIEKKAKNQLKKSFKYLSESKKISVQNERGDKIEIELCNIETIHKVIIYYYPEQIPAHFISHKYYRSNHIGFIHIFDFVSYKNLFEILFTPIEIIDYLNFREQHLSLVFNAKKETEKYLLGRYLLSPKVLDEALDSSDDDFSEYVDKLELRISEYDMRYIFASIRERMFVTQGDDLEKTVKNMHNALNLWVDNISKEGKSLPEPKYQSSDAPSGTQTFEVSIKY